MSEPSYFMLSMLPLECGTERCKHPTYKHTVYWATVYRGSYPVSQIGPYRNKAEATAKAERMLVEYRATCD